MNNLLLHFKQTSNNLKVIINNNEPIKDTFVYDMKYKNVFNEELFLELMYEFIEEINLNSVDPERKKAVLLIMFNIYSYMNISISAHFCPKDLFEFINFSDKIFEYNDIFRDLVKLYINEKKSVKHKDNLENLFAE